MLILERFRHGVGILQPQSSARGVERERKRNIDGFLGGRLFLFQLAPKVYSGFPVVSLASNVSGQPDVMQVCLEADANTAAESTLTALFSAQLMSILASMNVEVWLYLSPTGTVPALAQLTSGNFVGTILADPRHPNVGQ